MESGKKTIATVLDMDSSQCCKGIGILETVVRKGSYGGGARVIRTQGWIYL